MTDLTRLIVSERFRVDPQKRFPAGVAITSVHCSDCGTLLESTADGEVIYRVSNHRCYPRPQAAQGSERG